MKSTGKTYDKTKKRSINDIKRVITKILNTIIKKSQSSPTTVSSDIPIPWLPQTSSSSSSVLYNVFRMMIK